MDVISRKNSINSYARNYNTVKVSSNGILISQSNLTDDFVEGDEIEISFPNKNQILLTKK